MRTSLSFDIPFEKYSMGRIDGLIDEQIHSGNIENGIVKISVPEGSFLTTIEYDEDLVKDFKGIYLEYEKSHKENTDSYLFSKMPKEVMYVPFNMKRLVIGDWQQIVFFTLQDFDNLSVTIEFYEVDTILGLESIETTSPFQTLDITDIIERTLQNSNGENITLVSPTSSAILYTLHPNRYDDFVDFLKIITPDSFDYMHKHSWEDTPSAQVHLRASFISQILTLRTKKGTLELNGERLYLTELDYSHARRDIYFELWNERI